MSYQVGLQETEYRGGRLACLGHVVLLQRYKLALMCSVKCPGAVIVKAYDFARFTLDTEVTVVSGFHSPIEKDCLETLLRGTGPILICPARRLSASRLPREWQKAIEVGRMLLLLSFDDKQKRATAELAWERNRLVASIADEVLIVYAHPGGRTEALCLELITEGKRVYTFNDPANHHLIAMGSVPIEPNHFSTMMAL